MRLVKIQNVPKLKEWCDMIDSNRKGHYNGFPGVTCRFALPLLSRMNVLCLCRVLRLRDCSIKLRWNLCYLWFWRRRCYSSGVYRVTRLFAVTMCLWTNLHIKEWRLNVFPHPLKFHFTAWDQKGKAIKCCSCVYRIDLFAATGVAKGWYVWGRNMVFVWWILF